MGRLFWPVVLVLTFAVGWAAGGAVRHVLPRVPEVEQLEAAVARLQQQVATLQARLRAREDLAAARQRSGSRGPGDSAAWEGPGPARSSPRGGVFGAAVSDGAAAGDGAAGAGSSQLGAQAPTDRTTAKADARGAAGPPPSVETALDRFYKYLEATTRGEGRGGWQRARELVEDLRAMGDVAGQALMHVLTAGSDSDERRAAARLLGTLQIPQSLPLLKDILDRDDDVLLRRAAASGLRQLQTPESIPVMERILVNPNEDRMVRLSAAYGLAESGKALGVNGLAYIFQESSADGRGREIAFRALTSLNDERPLPFMRQIVSSDAEPGFRLRAIKYVTAQGDRQALGALQAVMQSPTEQASIRDAAAQAYRVISGR